MTAHLSADAYRNMVVIDGKGFLKHNNKYIGGGSSATEEFLAEVRSSGLTAVSTTVGGSRSFEDTVAFVTRTNEALAARPDALLKISNGADILEAKNSTRLGVIYDVQGTHELDGKVERIAALARSGVRAFQLTYNKAALVGDGCTEGRNAGLSDFGREVIAAIEAERCLLDLSHAGRRTTAEGIATAKRPCAITHAGCNAVTPHPRNVDDAEIKAIANNGGVFGVYFMTYLRAEGQSVREDVFAHIEHAIQVAGEDHVSIGTDGDIGALVLDEAFLKYWRVEVCEPRVRAGIAAPNEGPDIFNYVPEYNVPDRFRLFGDDLLQRGHSLSRVEKILGGNLHRLYREVFA